MGCIHKYGGTSLMSSWDCSWQSLNDCGDWRNWSTASVTPVFTEGKKEDPGNNSIMSAPEGWWSNSSWKPFPGTGRTGKSWVVSMNSPWGCHAWQTRLSSVTKCLPCCFLLPSALCFHFPSVHKCFSCSLYSLNHFFSYAVSQLAPFLQSQVITLCHILNFSPQHWNMQSKLFLGSCLTNGDFLFIPIRSY